jgi:hypothetical protein
MSLQTDIAVNVAAAYQAALDLTTPIAAHAIKNALSLSSGTGNGQADLVFSDTRTIAASSSENLDLAGVLADAFGATLTFVKIKAIYIKAAAGNTNDVVVGGAASNGFVNWVADTTDKINIRPGGVFLLVDPQGSGYAVTASTGDILKVANSGGTTGVTYDIVIIGTSA